MDEKLAAILDETMESLREMETEDWTNGVVEETIWNALKRAAKKSAR